MSTLIENTIAVIGARSGSTRIDKKNIRDFRGRPLITYVIEEIQKAGVPHVFVGTDSDEIAAISEAADAKVLFMSDAEAAGDMTCTDVADFLTTKAAARSFNFDNFLVAYGTSVFATAKDIKDGFDLMIENNAGACVPVTTYDFPPLRSFMIHPERNNLFMVNPQYEFTHHQNLPEMYHDAGQWYWLNRQKFKTHRRIFQPETQALLLDRNKTQDIDTLEDWARAEMLFDILVKRGER